MSDSSIAGNSPEVRTKLDAVSPSLYGNLKLWRVGKSCPLQFLWRGKPMLAPNPAAKLGDIVHGLMKMAPSSQRGIDARTLWETARAEVEAGLRRHWPNWGLLPLDQKARGYELKRQMTLRSITQILARRDASSGAPAASGQVLREEELKSSDGILKGQIDLAEERPEGWVLTDFKSGEVLEDDGDEGFQVKESYALQLLLYACLLQEARGITINQAVLKTLDGKEYPVELDESRVTQAGVEARQLLQAFNGHVQNNPLPESLCVPMPSSRAEGVFGCVGCLFRPACKGYKEKKKTASLGGFWPRDVWGSVVSVTRLAGRVELEIQSDNDMRDEHDQRVDAIMRVSLEDSVDRHPALKNVGEGRVVGVYDYLKGRSSSVAQDGPRTCVYSG